MNELENLSLEGCIIIALLIMIRKYMCTSFSICGKFANYQDENLVIIVVQTSSLFANKIRQGYLNQSKKFSDKNVSRKTGGDFYIFLICLFKHLI